jgi:hypothetical protein
MGSQGKMYYHCEPALNGSVRVRTVEKCTSQQSAGDGEIQWTITYDELNRIKYIQNASYADPNNPPDCNDINGSTQAYVYEYVGDSENPSITFKTRPTTGSAWQPAVRQWQVEFDDQDRAVKYQDGCGGCSGGTGNFEHIEYHSQFEDAIVRRMNADGTILVDNTYEEFEFGQYEPAGWIYVPDGGFEQQEVDVYDDEVFVDQAFGWESINSVPTARIYDPNGSQYLSFMEQEDALAQNLYPVMPNTRYRLDIRISAHTGQSDSLATVVLYAVKDGSQPEELDRINPSSPSKRSMLKVTLLPKPPLNALTQPTGKQTFTKWLSAIMFSREAMPAAWWSMIIRTIRLPRLPNRPNMLNWEQQRRCRQATALRLFTAAMTPMPFI